MHVLILEENDDLPLGKRLRSTVSSASTCTSSKRITRTMSKSLGSTTATTASYQVHTDVCTMSHSACHRSQNCGQLSGKASSHNYSLGKGRSRAKSLTVPRRSLRLSSSSFHPHNLNVHHKSSSAKPVDLNESKYKSKEAIHTQSEGRQKSRRIVTVPLTNVLLNGCNYIANSSHQNDVKKAQWKSGNDDQQDCNSNNAIMTRSHTKSDDIQTMHISPIKAKPSLLTAECKCKTSRAVQLRSDSQIYISPMYTPDLLSPTSSGKLDISIECHSRKSLSDLELCGVIGSKSKQEPEVITSNNVVVALTVTEDEQIGGMSVQDGQIHHSTPKLDHVACITIETGSQSDEQSRAPVEISIRPDLFSNLHSFGSIMPSLPSDQ